VAITIIGLAFGCAGPSQSAAGDGEPTQSLDARPQWTQRDIEAGMSAIGSALVDCYQNAVKVNRKEAGAVTISAAIAPDGHVESATPVSSSLSPGLASCLTDVVRTARFRAPGVQGVRLSIPLAFEQADAGAP
jgi:TonB family protein